MNCKSRPVLFAQREGHDVIAELGTETCVAARRGDDKLPLFARRPGPVRLGRALSGGGQLGLPLLLAGLGIKSPLMTVELGDDEHQSGGYEHGAVEIRRAPLGGARFLLGIEHGRLK